MATWDAAERDAGRKRTRTLKPGGAEAEGSETELGKRDGDHPPEREEEDRAHAEACRDTTTPPPDEAVQTEGAVAAASSSGGREAAGHVLGCGKRREPA